MVIKNNLEKELERIKAILDQTPMDEFKKQLEECGMLKTNQELETTYSCKDKGIDKQYIMYGSKYNEPNNIISSSEWTIGINLQGVA